MLRQLAIRNVVLVEALEIEFERGLGVLTGETGAGKSILLDALGLALGARSEAGLVRSGQESASVSAELELGGDHPAHALLSDQGIEAETGEPLILRRTLKADGGSRAFVGASPVPAGLLREIGSQAVEIHGQHDDRGLLNPRGHRALLDAFGRLDTGRVAEAWAEVTRIEAELGQARAQLASAERERDWLAHSLGEIEALSPQSGEESRLAEERSEIQAGIKAGESLTGLDELLGGSDGALAQLRLAARRIERGAAEHPLLAEALAALDRALIDAAEAEDRIERAADALACDPARLESVEARLFDIRGLARKHRVEPDALAELGARMRARLSEIDAGGERIAGLDQALEEARLAYSRAAADVSRERHAAAERLDRAVAAELHRQARRRALPHRDRGGRARARRHRPRGIRSLDQSRRAVRPADAHRQRRRTVALHPRAQGRACRGGQRGHDDLRRGRPRRRRSGGKRDRRAARAARAPVASAGGHPFPPGRCARDPPFPDREDPRPGRNAHDRAAARRKRAARGDCAHAVGRRSHGRSARPGRAIAGGGMSKQRPVGLEFEGEELESVFVGRRDNQPRPTVILFPTVMGVSELELGYARQLVELGYSAFAADPFGKKFQGAPRETMVGEMNRLKADRAGLRRRLLALFEQVRGLDGADGGHLAAAGFCFGGMCALDLARSGADVAGVASFHGLFDPAGLDPRPIGAKVIAFHGWDDPLAPPDKVVALANELTEAGADWQIHAYGHVQHGFTNPKADGSIPGVVHNRTAAERAWTAFVNFLEELFGEDG